MVEAFEISPNEIFFRKIQVDNTYEIVVLVKNLTKKAKRIRVFQPKSQRFRCDYDIKGPIAAGLTVKMIVRYFIHFYFISNSNLYSILSTSTNTQFGLLINQNIYL